MRLDKAVSLSGLTRRDARRAISAGRVTINGIPFTDAALNLRPEDRVALDGAEISLKVHAHVMLNKPAGVLTATEDARGEKTVMDFLPEALVRRGMGPVGRLDKDVTGLILLTTDGQLAHRLISPRWEIEKRYFARVEGRLLPEHAEAFQNGIALSDFQALPARLEILEAGESESLCRVYVKEGKYHQVKRMLLAVGHPVLALRREKIGPVTLDPALSEGEWRPLTDEEERLLYRITEMPLP